MSDKGNPQVDSADVHALEAMIDRYGFLGLAEMLVEIAEEREDDLAAEAFDEAAEIIAEEGDDGAD